MPAFHLLPLGVGDAFSALYYSSSLALEADGHWLLIDCPHPIRKMLHEAGLATERRLDIEQLDGVVLTHLHADHASGLEGLGFFSHFVLKRSLPLFAHPDVAVGIWPQLAGTMERLPIGSGEPRRHRLQEYFDLRLITAEDPASIGPFTIRCRPTVHSLPSIAVRVDACGRSLAYSSDTVFDPGLIGWLAKADFVVHESGHGGMHTAYADLLTLGDDVRRKLRIIHYDDSFDVAQSQLEPLRQGKLYVI